MGNRPHPLQCCAASSTENIHNHSARLCSFFPVCYTWTSLGAGELPAFFFSAADILQLLDKYSSRGSAGSVRGQQQTPRHNAEHLSPPPLALRCTASASPRRLAPLPLVATHVGMLAFSHLTFTLFHAKKANYVLQVFRCGLCRRHFHQGKEATSEGGGDGCKHWSCNPDFSDDNFLTTSTSKSKDHFFSAYWIFRRLTVKMECAPSASEDIWLDHIEWLWQTHYQKQKSDFIYWGILLMFPCWICPSIHLEQ